MIEISQITEVNQHIVGLKAILFDLDDTLYGEKEYVRSGYRVVAAILSQVEDCEEKLWSAFEEGKSAFDEVLKNEGIYTDELKQKCLRTYRFQQPDIHLYAGVAEMLVQLRAAGYKLGIITDGRPEGQRAKIEALGLGEYIDHIIITDELGGIEYRKPNDTAFRMMKEKLDVEFPEICYVGDNIKKDFMAPEKLGMRCIWFRNKDGLYFTPHEK
ncbi:MAG: HAD-IA family hydrolase [Clostridiales bacterium]|nr:HAD-IA family hydrolase [Clostridiales bacterium]